jgi:RNA polymerase sigma factor (sigma-70 family)
MNELIRRVARAAGTNTYTDGDLLTAYLQDRDPAAFAGLVDRLGPMVYAACRRHLSDPNDADDAFQASFLVLLRKASTIQPPGNVRPWLYGVACRTALAARKGVVRRLRLDRAYAEFVERQPTTDPPSDAAELGALIDRELARLPETYRTAVVLCDVQGCSRKEAAAELGWPEGTLSCRLDRARKILARRLTKAGVMPAAGGILVCVAQGATVPPRLRAAAEGLAAGARSASPAVRRLADLAAPGLSGFRPVILLSGAVIVLLTAMSGLAWMSAVRPQPGHGDRLAEQPQPEPAALPGRPPIPPPPPDAEKTWCLVATAPGKTVTLLDTDGTVLDPSPFQIEHLAVLSPDRTRSVRVLDVGKDAYRQLYVEDLDPSGKTRSGRHVTLREGSSSVHFADPAWSPDGKRLICLCDRDWQRSDRVDSFDVRWQVFTLDADGSNLTRLSPRDYPVGRPRFHPDGRRYAYVLVNGVPSNTSFPAHNLLMFPTESYRHLTEVTRLIDYAFSPDGKMVAISHGFSPSGLRIDLISSMKYSLSLLDVETGSEETITSTEAGIDELCAFTDLCWRPDSGALAFRPRVTGGTLFNRQKLDPNVIPRPVTVFARDRVGVLRIAGRPRFQYFSLDSSFELNHWRPAPAPRRSL